MCFFKRKKINKLLSLLEQVEIELLKVITYDDYIRSANRFIRLANFQVKHFPFNNKLCRRVNYIVYKVYPLAQDLGERNAIYHYVESILNIIGRTDDIKFRKELYEENIANFDVMFSSYPKGTKIEGFLTPLQKLRVSVLLYDNCGGC